MLSLKIFILREVSKDTVNYDDVIIRRRKCMECLRTQYTKEEDYDNDKEAAMIVYEYKNKPWLQNNRKE